MDTAFEAGGGQFDDKAHITEPIYNRDFQQISEIIDLSKHMQLDKMLANSASNFINLTATCKCSATQPNREAHCM